MKGLLLPILLAFGTAMCWGMYGPALGNARSPLKPPEGWSPFKPYVFIGVAYLVIAIVGGLVAMKFKGDTFSFSGNQVAARNWGFIAGSLGAAGALFLTNAVIISKGNTALVMPIVFGGAVTVNALFSYSQLRKNPDLHISGWLWAGMALVALGVILVATNTPHGVSAKKTAPVEAPEAANTDADGS